VAAAGVLQGSWRAQVLEVAALRGAQGALEDLARSQGEALPGPGEAHCRAPRLSLCVRPQRWLLLQPADAADAPERTRAWQDGCRGLAAAVDVSSALSVFLLSGVPVREVLARGCRLDLHPREFRPGMAASTIMAQVPVILAALPGGMLLLSPSSTAQHLREWLEATARPFGEPGPLDIEALFSDEMATRYP
jgi:sarcosine oxidase subunit gamma